jgi:hypothetical protein
VPRLLLLVQRCYPLQYYCRGSKALITPKALASLQRQAERQQEQVGRRKDRTPSSRHVRPCCVLLYASG